MDVDYTIVEMRDKNAGKVMHNQLQRTHLVMQASTAAKTTPLSSKAQALNVVRL